jgi:IS5 family transposase
VLADRGYDAQAHRQWLQAHGLRDGIARRAKPGQVKRQRLDAHNKAINRIRARGEHVFAGLAQLGGKRLVWLVRHDPCGWVR